MAKRKKTNTKQRRLLNKLRIERFKLESLRQQIDIEKEKVGLLISEKDKQLERMAKVVEMLENSGASKNRITETIGFKPQNYNLLKKKSK